MSNQHNSGYWADDPVLGRVWVSYEREHRYKRDSDAERLAEIQHNGPMTWLWKRRVERFSARLKFSNPDYPTYELWGDGNVVAEIDGSKVPLATVRRVFEDIAKNSFGGDKATIWWFF